MILLSLQQELPGSTSGPDARQPANDGHTSEILSLGVCEVRTLSETSCHTPTSSHITQKHCYTYVQDELNPHTPPWCSSKNLRARYIGKGSRMKFSSSQATSQHPQVPQNPMRRQPPGARLLGELVQVLGTKEQLLPEARSATFGTRHVQAQILQKNNKMGPMFGEIPLIH